MNKKIESKENTNLLKKTFQKNNIFLFGIADLENIKKNHNYSNELLNDFNFGISIGCALSFSILKLIKNTPTSLYLYHYKRVNIFLDDIALKISGIIQQKGYNALPVPSSHITDWQIMEGDYSHRQIALYAGLGWRGRNNLLVNPIFGAQIRLVSVLTNMPLLANTPLNTNCKNCFACVNVCPAKAIKENSFDLDKCKEQLNLFSKEVGVSVCGICVKVCSRKGNKNKLKIICPDCKEELESVVYQDIIISKCLKCNSFWLNKYELYKIQNEKNIENLEKIHSFKKKSFEIKKSEKYCPQCQSILYQVKYLNYNIIVEACKDCLGMLLNKESFDKIHKYIKDYPFDLKLDLEEKEEIKNMIIVIKVFAIKIALHCSKQIENME
ncbi:MAG: hypothetical protein ABIB46_02110 [bacterium]